MNNMFFLSKVSCSDLINFYAMKKPGCESEGVKSMGVKCHAAMSIFSKQNLRCRDLILCFCCIAFIGDDN